MAARKGTVAVGVFEDAQKARQAVQELRQMGFTETEIGIAGPDSTAENEVEGKGSKAATGAAVGAATGAGLGALWGIAIVAGFLPAIGPAIAGGALAAILSSAAAGAAAAGLAGALIGLGIPEEEAEFYESEFKQGRTVVTVQAGGRFEEAMATLRRFGAYDASNKSTAVTSAACTPATHVGAEKTIQRKEEELRVKKQAVEAGDVTVRKVVHTESRTLEVPVRKEEVIVERHPVTGKQPAASNIEQGEVIRVPVTEEEIHVEKQPVVKEEITIGKRSVQNTERVEGTIRKEDVQIEEHGDAKVRKSNQ